MYTDKDSKLISDLRTKYGEDSVRTFRRWEIIIKKMADYRNHRRFMLKCIKASITPVSCKLKNPLSYKSTISYQIMHKVEKQLLYGCIRNINNILATLDKQREDQYKKFKDTIHNHEQDLDKSRLFINKIKEHRHDKIKRKHIKKFKKLHFKHHGYHHNINRHTPSFDNINSGNDTLSGQPNVPSSFSTSSTTTFTTSSIPATPMAPTPSTQAMATHQAPRQPSSSTNTSTSHACINHMDKWVINLSKTPLTKEQLSLLQKGPNVAITPKYPP